MASSYVQAPAARSQLTLVPSDVVRLSAPQTVSTLLVVDFSLARRQTLITALRELGHNLVEAATTSEALREIERQRIDAVLVDSFIPGIGAVGLCRKLKATPGSETMPVLVIAPDEDVEGEVLALESGAAAFLVAPLHPKALRARVRACLRDRLLIDSLDQTEAVLFTLAQSVEGRDPALGEHCQRLARMATAMGLTLGLPPSDIATLQRAGYLHDIGKIALPDSVLIKPGPLTAAEWDIMKTHSERGEKICSGVRSLASVLPIIRHHHEKWDGSGYPDGLKGEQIPLLARIVQTADIYDALTAARPYKRAFSPEEALQILKDESQAGIRDPKLIPILEAILPAFHIDSAEQVTQGSLRALSTSLQYSETLRPAALVGA